MKYIMKCNPEFSESCYDETCKHRSEHDLNEGCSKHCFNSMGELACIWINSTIAKRVYLYVKNYIVIPIKEKRDTLYSKLNKLKRGF